jgi:hypothetical protein
MFNKENHINERIFSPHKTEEGRIEMKQQPLELAYAGLPREKFAAKGSGRTWHRVLKWRAWKLLQQFYQCCCGRF